MFLSDDDMVECPYNKTHRMLRRRLQTHLHKCRINYPDVELRKCPFNITHLIPEPEYVHHATNCPDRKLITQYKYDAPEPKEEEIPKHAPIECDEDWDDTDVNDYNPQKYLENAQIIRKPDGVNVSERKKFIKKERKRLGDGDDSSEDECKQTLEVKEKTRSPNSYKRCGSSEEDDYSERSHGSKSYSNRSKRSRSPATSSHLRKRSRSPYGRSGRALSRSNSPDDYKKTYTNRRSPDYSRPYSSQADSFGATLGSYNPDQNAYYNGGRCEDSNSFSNSSAPISHYNHNDESNISMPEAPPPPMISYPAPRSYSTAKHPPSARY